ncbi:hypothetical protein CMV_016417 [Castanea mollissima]|uniref:Uncharacterized protein n=1 Tax=Castanea mollissima TaxID=60419 RepID=A0A8J4R769_9ROSI|nr:hypothetical protein CMV_016417 [Castanea mollissima]
MLKFLFPLPNIDYTLKISQRDRDRDRDRDRGRGFGIRQIGFHHAPLSTMEGNSSRPNLKRPFFEDADDDKPSAPKRVRFPKGKKVKAAADEAVVVVDRGPAVDDDPTDLMNPRAAAKERAKRRTQFTAELFTEESRGILNDVAAAEVDYKHSL